MQKEGLLMDPVQFDLYHVRRRAAASRWRKGRMEEVKHVRGFGETRRKAAKMALLRTIESVGADEKKEKILALFSLNTGHSMRRAEEYLDELVAAGLVEVEGNIVVSKSRGRPKDVKEL